MTKPLTQSQLLVIKTLANRERLTPGMPRSTEGFAPAAITSLRTRGLVKTDYMAIFGKTYIELTDLGRTTVCAIYAFEPSTLSDLKA